ncbi:DUF5134 domain-containing protein [Nocardia sp. NBC_00416]|uniref:DUF5134 domain-containing protein n=1 Tax=Nocardia sp. NBC_00416 TaxID=2975991 RepID=UPI002E208F68
MAGFVLDQAGVRALVAAVFVVSALVVLARVTAAEPIPAGDHGGAGGCTPAGADHESDAAHLLMCGVMLVMVLFPDQVSAHALHGVLLAMTLVFTLLLVDRLARRYRGPQGRPGHRVAAIGYHLAAAGVMLVTMSGHSGAGHTGGPGAAVVLAFAALFVVDAAVVIATARGHRGHWWSAHPAPPISGRAVPIAILPHLIMDLGMAYMLIAAALA